MPNLYQLKESLWDAVNDAQEDEDGEWAAAMTGFLQGEVEDKLDSIACVVKQLAADAAQLKAAEVELQSRRFSIETKVKNLKKYAAEMILALPPADLKPDGTPIYPKFKKNLFGTRVQRENRAWDHDKCDMKQMDEKFIKTEKQPLYSDAMKVLTTTGEIPAGFGLKEERWGLRIQ